MQLKLIFNVNSFKKFEKKNYNNNLLIYIR